MVHNGIIFLSAYRCTGILLTMFQGPPVVWISLAVMILAALGWAQSRLPALVKCGFLGPLVLIAVWTLIPGQRFSPRLFILLVPVVMMGCGLFFGLREQGGKIGAIVSGALLCGWLYAQSPVFQQHLQIGYPDTRGLAERLEGSRVNLYMQMADVNAYYFSYATVFRLRPETKDDWNALFDADYIIRGTNPEKPLDKDLLAAGWSVEETLMSWRPRHPCFRVWVKE